MLSDVSAGAGVPLGGRVQGRRERLAGGLRGERTAFSS